MTTASIYEQVRRDLLQREYEDIQQLGAARSFIDGPESLLDAYDDALSLCCQLRTIIENLTIGQVTQ